MKVQFPEGPLGGLIEGGDWDGGWWVLGGQGDFSSTAGYGGSALFVVPYDPETIAGGFVNNGGTVILSQNPDGSYVLLSAQEGVYQANAVPAGKPNTFDLLNANQYAAHQAAAAAANASSNSPDNQFIDSLAPNPVNVNDPRFGVTEPDVAVLFAGPGAASTAVEAPNQDSEIDTIVTTPFPLHVGDIDPATGDTVTAAWPAPSGSVVKWYYLEAPSGAFLINALSESEATLAQTDPNGGTSTSAADQGSAALAAASASGMRIVGDLGPHAPFAASELPEKDWTSLDGRERGVGYSSNTTPILGGWLWFVGMTGDFIFGGGPFDYLYFGPNSWQTQDLRTASQQIQDARNFFYQKNQGLPLDKMEPVYNFIGKWDTELLASDTDPYSPWNPINETPAKEFVGSYTVDVDVYGSELIFTAHNATSISSLLGWLPADIKNSIPNSYGEPILGRTELDTMYQTFLWTEPIDPDAVQDGFSDLP